VSFKKLTVTLTSFGPGGILSMAERAITGKQRPVDFVSARRATTAYGAHVGFPLRFPDDDTEVISAPRARSGEV
jgi:hypothetical protein